MLSDSFNYKGSLTAPPAILLLVRIRAAICSLQFSDILSPLVFRQTIRTYGLDSLT